MHRHGYSGRKLQRERDQRRALIKGLASSLIRDEKIETTLPKAKEVLPYTEKLITKAKVGTLHARRQVMSDVDTPEIANRLVDEIAPKLTARSSGHLRIKRTTLRRGDNAQMATVSFVDDLKKTTAPAKATKATPAAKKPTATKKVATKTTVTTKKPAAKKAAAKKEAK